MSLKIGRGFENDGLSQALLSANVNWISNLSDHVISCSILKLYSVYSQLPVETGLKTLISFRIETSYQLALTFSLPNPGGSDPIPRAPVFQKGGKNTSNKLAIVTNPPPLNS